VAARPCHTLGTWKVLELVAPALEADEVVRRENTWKERLHTRKEYGGLNDN
jgi:hypothetical protein